MRTDFGAYRGTAFCAQVHPHTGRHCTQNRETAPDDVNQAPAAASLRTDARHSSAGVVTFGERP